MSSKTQEEYKRDLYHHHSKGNIAQYNKSLYEWVKTGKITRSTFTEVQEHVINPRGNQL